jgi:hypothetical protein
MFNEGLRGSIVAFIVLAFSVFCLYLKLVPTYYFAAVLAGWILYSLYRLLALFAKRSVISGGNALAYWFGALGSSLLVPLLWMLIVARIKVF